MAVQRVVGVRRVAWLSTSLVAMVFGLVGCGEDADSEGQGAAEHEPGADASDGASSGMPGAEEAASAPGLDDNSEGAAAPGSETPGGGAEADTEQGAPDDDPTQPGGAQAGEPGVGQGEPGQEPMAGPSETEDDPAPQDTPPEGTPPDGMPPADDPAAEPMSEEMTAEPSGEEETGTPSSSLPSPGACRVSHDTDSDGEADYWIDTTYDEAGRVLSESTTNAAGQTFNSREVAYGEEGRVIRELSRTAIPDSVYAEELVEYEYDERGNIISEKMGGTFDIEPITESPPAIGSVITRTFDQFDQLLTETTDSNNDGGPEEIRTFYRDEEGRFLYSTVWFEDDAEERLVSRRTYDENGFVIKQESGTEFGGQFVRANYFENDAAGNPLVETIYSVDSDGVEGDEPIYVITRSYDEEGREVYYQSGDHVVIHEYAEDGKLMLRDDTGGGNDYIDTYAYADDGSYTAFSQIYSLGELAVSDTKEYNAAGDVERHVRISHGVTGLEAYERETLYTYGDDGQLIRSEIDEGMNGTIDSLTVITRDARGRVVLQEQDEDGDGVFEQRDSVSYDCTP